jgi:hypothetical protein
MTLLSVVCLWSSGGIRGAVSAVSLYGCYHLLLFCFVYMRDGVLEFTDGLSFALPGWV